MNPTRQAARFMCAVALAAIALPAAATMPELPTFAATYRLEYKGSRVGESVVSMRPAADGQSYVYEARTEPRGLARFVRGGTLIERSRFVVSQAGLEPVEFVFDDGTRKGKDDNLVSFDRENASATSTYRGETHQFDLEPGIFDRLLSQYALMRDLADGGAAASYTVLDRDKLKIYQVSRVGEETVKTPAGEYQALVLRRQREGSSRATLMWFVADLDWLPVRIRQLKDGKPVTEMSLESLAGLPAGT